MQLAERKFGWLMGAGLALALSASTALAIPIDVTATGDTYYRRNERTTNFDGVELEVKNDGTGNRPSRVTMLRFDTGAITATVGTASLSLSLSAIGLNSNYNVYGILETNPDEDFDETVLTFNTSNDADGVAGFDEGDVAMDTSKLINLGTWGLTTSQAGTTVSFSSAALIAFLNDDTNGIISFAIQRQEVDASVTKFHSKETSPSNAGAIVPTLSYDAVPEPASLVLMGLGGLVMLTPRRQGNGLS